MLPPNLLYYGDNLDVLRRHVKDESVDLVYLDPPFKSNQDYNVLFAEHGTRSAAQIKAFEDTWRWDEAASRALWETIDRTGGEVAQALLAFQKLLGNSDMLAYLAMMAPRLVELRRVLKRTGSLFLHCDPAASHYLKIIMDAILAPENFRNEIVWKRTSAHSSAKRFGPVHDVLLFYARSSEARWYPVDQPYDAHYVRQRFARGGERPWKDADLTGSGVRHGETGELWRGFDPTAKGRHWAYPPAELDRLDAEGLVYWPKKTGAWPRFKRYLDEARGVPAQDVWTDIQPINSQARERLGYPTQKPEALLERILSAASAEGDTVLDPFCGCGTTIAVAQRLNRRWAGIDVTHLAINLIRHRLKDAYGDKIAETYSVIGEPVSLDDAAQLAGDDPYQFQWWALGLVGARPVEQKKGADKGIDGRIYFRDEAGSAAKQIILSVKAGHTSVAHIRDLRGVLEREQAEIGALLTLQEPTQPMRAEAAGAGFYTSEAWGTSYPRVQLLTVRELLEGKTLAYPHVTGETFKRAPRAHREEGEQSVLPFGE